MMGTSFWIGAGIVFFSAVVLPAIWYLWPRESDETEG